MTWTPAEAQRIGAAWYRRDTGWFGRTAVDAAYEAKYGRSGGTGRMVTDEAAMTTLRLSPAASQA